MTHVSAYKNYEKVGTLATVKHNGQKTVERVIKNKKYTWCRHGRNIWNYYQCTRKISFVTSLSRLYGFSSQYYFHTAMRYKEYNIQRSVYWTIFKLNYNMLIFYDITENIKNFQTCFFFFFFRWKHSLVVRRHCTNSIWIWKIFQLLLINIVLSYFLYYQIMLHLHQYTCIYIM